MINIAVIFHHFGPYHRARLNAASARLRVSGVELSAEPGEYAWDRMEEKTQFDHHRVFGEKDSRKATATELLRRVYSTLNSLKPDVVAIPGWSDKGALAGLCWCIQNRVPAVLLSASQAQDEPRTWWKELIKRTVVKCYSTALVGGQPQAEYLQQLGMPAERVFPGYDVVDNEHFSAGADEARRDAATCRSKLRLPEKYLLVCSRFIPKKNLFRLVNAYALYRQRATGEPWQLVLMGDGPLKADILKLREELGLKEHIVLTGFKQYAELPTVYGLASAFVHPSTSEQWGLVVNEAMAAGLPVLVSNRCGCAPDLVTPENGFVFDPLDTNGLVQALLQVADSRCDRAAMGQKSREIVSHWGPDRFAKGLALAAALALIPKRKNYFGSALLVRALIYR